MFLGVASCCAPVLSSEMVKRTDVKQLVLSEVPHSTAARLDLKINDATEWGFELLVDGRNLDVRTTHSLFLIVAVVNFFGFVSVFRNQIPPQPTRQAKGTCNASRPTP